MFDKLKMGLKEFLEKASRTDLDDKTIGRLLEELKITLLQNDVAYPVAEDICLKLKIKLEQTQIKRFSDPKKAGKKLLREVLLETLGRSTVNEFFDLVENKRLDREPAVMVFIGINGTGKTTTIAKIAHLLLSRGYTTVLACSDTYRTGSIEQIEEHAKRLGVKAIKHKYGSDAAAVAYDTINHARAQGIDVVLIDTAGRMQTNKNLLDEMAKIVRIAKPDLTILIVDALTGNDAVEQALTFSKSVPIDGIILTKLDADAKGGSAISVSHITKKPVIFIGTGQDYKDLTPFEPTYIVDRILEES
ncbi:signal recognition particle-docking protein FtsY [Candidatus Bathyarchaeota archaeon]|nr:signal recognition particle-docking protein FtsY [Candidatus Bathyarchaeota archaeon]MBS7628472.1 signal recognition particle-docking protein FtsY [Candidatus Bathyarchaeota archaeon]